MIIRQVFVPDIVKFNDSPGGKREVVLKEGLSRFYEVSEPIVMKPDVDSLYEILAVDRAKDILHLKLEAIRNKGTYKYESIGSSEPTAILEEK